MPLNKRPKINNLQSKDLPWKLVTDLLAFADIKHREIHSYLSLKEV